MMYGTTCVYIGVDEFPPFLPHTQQSELTFPFLIVHMKGLVEKLDT